MGNLELVTIIIIAANVIISFKQLTRRALRMPQTSTLGKW